MNRLRTRFALALSLVLIVTTLLPMLTLYLLSTSGLVEATYVTQGDDTRQNLLPPDLTAEGYALPRLPLIVENLDPDVRSLFPMLDPETGERFSGLVYDPATGLWTVSIPSDQQRILFTSSVFKFRIDLPAWLALGSLPVIGLLLGILLSILLSRGVTRPVTQLAQAAQAIGRRELGYRVAAAGSQELQDLAGSFNRMAEQLEQAEANRRNLMADVAHELRTPLSVLDGNLRAILDGVHELDESEIALLYEQTHHLTRLVDDLRELSLAEANQLSLNRQPVDLALLVGETAAYFDLLAREQEISLSTSLVEPLVHPNLDKHRLRQVLHNLLSNAFRFTPRGGSVQISAKPVEDDRAVEITVSDSGAGISPEELPHIFDRFYRTGESASPDRTGSGLGLAIVKAIVTAHGGSISAHSEGKGQGSTFTIRLPE
jgi:signal transduction histidine kinase